jgi:hypothetical protein
MQVIQHKPVRTWAFDDVEGFWLCASANRLLITGSAALRQAAKCDLVEAVRNGAMIGRDQ